MADINDMARQAGEVEKAIGKAANIIKVEGLQFIHDNFDKQGFESAPGKVNKWKPRKVSTNKKKAKKEAKASRSILVNRGNLRRTWDTETNVEGPKVVFQNSLPYAQVHNEGGKAGRGTGFIMPQREMIGESAELDARIEAKIDKLMDAILGS